MDKNQVSAPVYVQPAGSSMRTVGVTATPVASYAQPVRTESENAAAARTYEAAKPVAVEGYKGADRVAAIERTVAKSDSEEGKKIITDITAEIKQLTEDVSVVAKLARGTSAGLAKAEKRLESATAVVGGAAFEAAGAAGMVVASIMLGDRRLTKSARESIASAVKKNNWSDAASKYRAAIQDWGGQLYGNLLNPAAIATAAQYFLGSSPNFQDPNIWFTGLTALLTATALGQDAAAKLTGAMPVILSYFSSNLAIEPGIKSLKLKSFTKTSPTTARFTFTCERGLFFVKGNEPKLELVVFPQTAPPANSVVNGSAVQSTITLKGDGTDEHLDATFTAPGQDGVNIIIFQTSNTDRAARRFVGQFLVTA